MNAAALLEVSRVLLAQAAAAPDRSDNRAAFVRCAINRMYYTCLWACRQAIIDVGCEADKVNGPNIHGFIMSCFSGQLQHEALIEVGDIFRLLKAMRNRADYKSADRGIESLTVAQGQLSNVEFVLKTLRDVRADGDKFSALQPHATAQLRISKGK